MKKIIATTILIGTLVTTLCGCEYNRTIIDTAWNYDIAIIQRADGEQKIEVKKLV